MTITIIMIIPCPGPLLDCLSPLDVGFAVVKRSFLLMSTLKPPEEEQQYEGIPFLVYTSEGIRWTK